MIHFRNQQWQQKQSSIDDKTEKKSESSIISEPPSSFKTKSKRHYNPRIADALEKMVGMGFTDDDGWLTQLLVMKHGDISQV